jgi:hypothetical protein
MLGSRTMWLSLSMTAIIAGVPAQFGGMAAAGTVDIFSGPEYGSNDISGSNTGVAVSPAWAVPTGPGYEWISYGATGCNTFVAATGRCTPGPANPVGTTVTGTPTAIFYQTFTITDPSDSGVLDVWADDTAGVWLDNGTVTTGNGSSGELLFAPNGTLGTNCANAPIGCLQQNDAQIPLNLTTGTYTLVFDAYQLVGGSPFGLMYAGVLSDTDASTPEPATYLLMGFGLAGLGALVRRRKRA